MQDIFKNILKDIQVDLNDEFDRNFERKAFFDRSWPATKLLNNRGSLMMRSGNLRNSITSEIQNDKIVWSSSLPYASIHNEGGTITVTAKMKRFFWAMYYKSGGAVTGTSQRDQRLAGEAAQWKALALMKVGQKMKIEQRQFIGTHPQVRKSIEVAFNANFKDIEKYMQKLLRKK